MSGSFRALRCFALAVAVAACAKDAPTSPNAHAAVGEWGGNNADVNFSDVSTDVTVKCSSGEFAGNVELDANGRFAIDGTWNQSTGPIQLDHDMPAQLSGQVVGNTLTFAIAVNDTISKQISSIGPATVVFGQQPTIEVCPVL